MLARCKNTALPAAASCPKLRPVESPTAGIFLSGACQGPKDIPETVAQASAAAAMPRRRTTSSQKSSKMFSTEVRTLSIMLYRTRPQILR